MGASFIHICCAAIVTLTLSIPALTQDNYDRLEKAAKSIQTGQLTQAESELQTILRQFPNDGNALNLLGVVRVQQKRLGEAEQLFLNAINHSRRLVGAYLNLGHLYLDQQKQERARWAYSEAANLDPENTETHYQLALLYDEAGDSQKALSELEKIPGSSWKIQEQYLAARCYLALGQTDKALELVASLKQTGTFAHEQIAAAFAAALLKKNLTTEAISILENSLAKNPDSFALNYQLAASYVKKREWTKAEEFFNRAFAIDRTNVETLLELAKIARAQGVLEKALSYLVQARKLGTNDPSVLYEFGIVAFNLNLIADSLPVAEQLYILKPDEPRYVHLLAVCRFRNDEKQEAEKLLRRYIELQPRDSLGYYLLGVTLHSVKRNAEAREWFEKSLAVADNADSRYMLGLIAQTEGDNATAVRWLKTINESAKCYPAAQTILGVAFAAQDNVALARATLERATNLNPRDLRAHYQLGLIYSKLGEKEQAKQMFAIADRLREEQRSEEVTTFKLIDPDDKN